MEKTSNSPNLKDSLQELFNHFDSNNDGLIDISELTQLLKELDETTEEESIQEFFTSVDSDEDSLISFEEFYTWFNLDEDAEAALLAKVRNYLDIQEQQEPEGDQSQRSQAQNTNNDTFDTHYARISFGDTFIPKTSVSVKLLVGTEADSTFQEVSNGLNFSENYGIIIAIHAKNPAKAEESVKSMISRVLDWLQNQLPSYSDLNLKQVKILTAVEGSVLKIGIESENSIINTLIEEYTKAQSKLIPDGFSANASLDIEFLRDPDSIFKEEYDPSTQNPPKRSILHYIFEGLQATLQVKVTNGILKKLRDSFLKSKEFSKLPSRLRDLAFLLLWQGTKAELAFKKFRGSFLEGMIPKKLDLGIEKLLTDLKEELNPMQRKHLILKTVLLLINKEFEANFKISVRAPRLLGIVEGKTKGIKEIYEHIST